FELIICLFAALYRRPMLALARMMLDPKGYIPRTEKMKLDSKPKLNLYDVLAREKYFELEAAQVIIRKMLKFSGIAEAQLKSAVESTGARWYELGEEMNV